MYCWFHHLEDYFLSVLSRRISVNDTSHMYFDAISDLFAMMSVFWYPFSRFSNAASPICIMASSARWSEMQKIC